MQVTTSFLYKSAIHKGMDSFEVTAKDTSLLDRSYLINEMKHEIESMDMYPVLIDEQVEYFHSIDGGYDSNKGYEIVNLIHQVEGPDSPSNNMPNRSVEAHLDMNYYRLDVVQSARLGEYPEENYVLSLKVSDYKIGPHSFSNALSKNIDGREQEFSPNRDNK